MSKSINWNNNFKYYLLNLCIATFVYFVLYQIDYRFVENWAANDYVYLYFFIFIIFCHFTFKFIEKRTANINFISPLILKTILSLCLSVLLYYLVPLIITFIVSVAVAIYVIIFYSVAHFSR